MLAALLLVPACGYTHGFHAQQRYGIKSVAILTAGNKTFRQGLDVQLTRQLGKDLSGYTGLVPGSPVSADARLEVTLVEAAGRPITEQGGGAILEGAILLAVEVRLIEQRTGRVLYQGKHSDWAEFRTPVGETLSSAIAESMADLSRKILVAVDGRFARPAPGRRVRGAPRPRRG